MKAYAIALPFSTCLLATAIAVQANPSQDEKQYEETHVWGTNVRSSSLYLGESDIAIKQADHLSDLLRDIPGVDIGGTHSVNTRINFRGLDDRDLAVYIDNALQTNYIYHHMGNLLVNADILKSADISVGANSVVNGGIGGALRFETKDAQDLLANSESDFGARIMVGHQSNAQSSSSFTGFGQLGDLDVIAYANRVDRDNFKDGDGFDTIGSDGTTDNFLGKLGYQVSANQRLELSYEALLDEGDYTQRPDLGVRSNQQITGDLLLPTEYERKTANLSYELDLGDAIDLTATAYKNDMYLWRDERQAMTRGGPGNLKSADAINKGVNLLAITNIDNAFDQTLSYGVEYFEQELFYRANIESNLPEVTERGESIAAFAESSMQFGPVNVRPGVRYNKFKKEVPGNNSEGSWDDISFALAFDYSVMDGLNLLASVTEIFKGPELSELFIGSAEDKIVNPNVEPESGENIELGLRYATDIGASQLRLGFNVFRTNIDNYVVEQAVGNETDNIWDINAGTATIDGGEASLNLVFDKFDVLLTYSKTDLDTSELELTNPGDSLRELGDNVGLEFRSQLGANLELVYNLRHVLEKDTVTDQTKPSYTVNNVSAAWNATPRLSVILGVDNLFDEQYTSHASRVGQTNHPFFGPLVLDDVEAGRNIKTSVSYQF